MVSPRLKRLLLVCTFLLGLQVLFPRLAQANNGFRANQGVSIGVKDPTKDDKQLCDLELITSALFFWSADLVERKQGSLPVVYHVECSVSLLPSVGYHPSAP